MNMEGLDLLEWFVAMERNPDEWNSVNENFAIRKYDRAKHLIVTVLESRPSRLLHKKAHAS
ncbi:hypothetical protein [Pseudomonas gingeri]|uniref:Uncharacterized protein n=1 Tax=Pseudomonas gingeri TaxID=117681 RepID=A0A7Y7YAA4_9PSED|nr:hypothetical protein [Pseudomonas gingeri]NWB26724.1 hypothetical protein [Pseudomonas gingeri]NWC32726.1 hypothetical protein [Pseudomonas gingeri]